MRVLLVYPESPTTFWSFEDALKFIAKRSSEPPLGLITVAALLPVAWDKRLVDTNVSALQDRDIMWADYVFISGMDIHRGSFVQVVERCRGLGVPVVAGGPMCSTDHTQFEGVDHFVLDEAEITLPRFVADLRAGHPQHVYRSDDYPDITTTPVPEWRLLEMDKYATMDVQYSRGCPFSCEFCGVTTLFGHKPRCKTSEQFLRELETLYQAGWTGSVFVVDDNLIGNKKRLKQELLPAMAEWSETRGHPFNFTAEVSIDLADDQELADMMVQAGFRKVFVGIETPADESLAECGKRQNRGRDLVESVNILQRSGLDVSAGFIIGFDSDRVDIFDRQIRFIQKSGIVTAMVGLLTAPLGTALFKRLSAENRVIHTSTGDNMDGSLNFIPVLDRELLTSGYRRVVQTIYSPRAYFERVKVFLSQYHLPQIQGKQRTPPDIRAFLRALWKLGIVAKGRTFFWRLLIHVVHRYPQRFADAVRMAIFGYHFRRVAESI